MAERLLDIFQVLSQIDKKNIGFYSLLTPAEQKAFVPVVITRWLTGTYIKLQVVLVNELINPYLFSLYKHPELLYKLMTICVDGKSQRYAWNKVLSRTISKPLATKTIQQYFNYSSREAEKSLNILAPDDVVAMAEELGWQNEDINKIRKEFGITAIKQSKSNKKLVKHTDILEL